MAKKEAIEIEETTFKTPKQIVSALQLLKSAREFYKEGEIEMGFSMVQATIKRLQSVGSSSV